MMCGLLAALVLGSTGVPFEADVYVSPSGNDAWSGTSSDRKGTDGPFRTLERARNEVRMMRRLKIMRYEPIRVALRGGTYRLEKTLELGELDSGTPTSSTEWVAYPGEKPIVSGAKVLKGWKGQADGNWTLTVPEAKGRAWAPLSLYLGDNRLPRARLPKKGWFRIAETRPSAEAFKGKGSDRFAFKAGDIQPQWAESKDAEVCTIMIWGMARMLIDRMEGDSVVFTGPTNYETGWGLYTKDSRYLVENIREGLLEPGQWHLDTQTGTFTVVRLDRRNPNGVEILAPALDVLVKGEDVHHVAFRGIEFRHAQTQLPKEGRNWPQAESDLPAAVQFLRSSKIVLDRCAVADVEGYGLELGVGTRDCIVKSCQFIRLGAGGVKIGDLAYHANETDAAQRNVLQHCTIAHGGRIHPAGVGVFIGQSGYNRIERNEIADFYYTGVSIGWSWGYAPTNSHHNLVRNNHIHDIGQGVLSDMGGVYHLGDAPGTEISYNLIHDVESFGYGGWGLYTDEGSTGVQLVGNVVYRTKSAGFHQHYGKDNRVADNVLAYGREAQMMRSREEPHLSFTFERNIVLWEDAPLLGSLWANDHFVFRNNIYWKADGSAFDFAGASLSDWRKRGHDVDSQVVDPGFVDPKKGDFRLKPESAARKMGFGEFEKALAAWAGKKPLPLAPPAFPLER